MIEDQVAPKKCGHTKGKSCVTREEAFARVQAACDARDEGRWNLRTKENALSFHLLSRGNGGLSRSSVSGVHE